MTRIKFQSIHLTRGTHCDITVLLVQATEATWFEREKEDLNDIKKPESPRGISTPCDRL